MPTAQGVLPHAAVPELPQHDNHTMQSWPGQVNSPTRRVSCRLHPAVHTRITAVLLAFHLGAVDSCDILRHYFLSRSANIPRNCQNGDGTCPLDPFTVVPHLSKFVDTQKLKLQERPEDVPTGELPRHW